MKLLKQLMMKWILLQNKKILIALFMGLFFFSIKFNFAQDRGFVHTTSASNILNNVTLIDSPELNNNPEVFFLFCQRYLGNDNNNPTGIWYDGSRWAIFNENGAPIPEGIQFNIYLPDPINNSVEIVIADGSNTTGNSLDLEQFSQINYLFYNTYYNPNEISNPNTYGNYFFETNRFIYAENENPIPIGAAFFVMFGSTSHSIIYTETSSSANITGNTMILDHPSLNNNPDAIFIFSHYWGFPTDQNQVLLPYVTETYYNTSINRWTIYAYGATNFPENITIDYMIPLETLSNIENQSILNSIEIYPNPVGNILHIKSDYEIESIEVFNKKGQKVIEKLPFFDNGRKLNVSVLESGVYILKFYLEDGEIQTKNIIKH